MAPRTLDSDTTPDARASGSDAANGSNASEVLALGPTLDSLDSFDSLDSDQDPHLMHRMHLKHCPRTLDSNAPPPDSGASESNAPNAANAAHESKFLALGGAYFRCMRCNRFGPGLE